MAIGKIIIDGKETTFSFNIDEDEIERNEENLDTTIDLKEVVKIVNEQDKKD